MNVGSKKTLFLFQAWQTHASYNSDPEHRYELRVIQVNRLTQVFNSQRILPHLKMNVAPLKINKGIDCRLLHCCEGGKRENIDLNPLPPGHEFSRSAKSCHFLPPLPNDTSSAPAAEGSPSCERSVTRRKNTSKMICKKKQKHKQKDMQKHVQKHKQKHVQKHVQ